ncbi:MAG: ferritin-like domain-containing protein [Xanthomonadales bacterium]|nr:ferritin-like domain-containing protein [Xanthomonadales bacterium]
MHAPWTPEDIDWSAFDPHRVDATQLAAVKAAALVEFNADDYVDYLGRVFADAPDVLALIRQWGEDERRHGLVLGRWAVLADPSFDFEAAMARFREGYRIHPDAAASVRGSRAGEMIARCIVECGTSSFYSSLRDAGTEPVLRDVAGRIARDEFSHYRLFHALYQRYAPADRVGLLRRLRIALGRVSEADDDELAYAWWSANVAPSGQPYERTACFRAQQRAALAGFRKDHVRRAVHMIARAVGLRPQGRLARAATGLAWWRLRGRGAGAFFPPSQ